VAEKPDEIWLLRINPQRRDSEPRTPDDIEDRRNELAGNLALNQELASIEMINSWLADGRLNDKGKKPIRVRQITISDAEASKLDHASKLDRSERFIQRLMAHGEAQMDALVEAFIAEQGQPARSETA
jgi:NTE family protein